MPEEATIIKGTPSFLLIPAREHEWTVDNERVQISVPKEGLISELLAKEALVEDIKIPGDDEFSIRDAGVFYMYELPRVLFALGKYPQLEDNQAFNVYAIEEVEENIIIHGAIIRFA